MKRFVFWSFSVRRLTFEHNMRRDDRKLPAQGKARLVTVITSSFLKMLQEGEKNVKKNYLRKDFKLGTVAAGYGRMTILIQLLFLILIRFVIDQI